MLIAADITTPNGGLLTLYDVSGQKYTIDRHIISDPLNMKEDEPEPQPAEDPVDVLRRRQAKGKGNQANMQKVRVRRSDNATDIEIYTDKSDTVDLIKVQVQDAGVTGSKVRLMYKGLELDDHKTLEEQVGYLDTLNYH